MSVLDPTTTALTVRIEREPIPGSMVGGHRVPFTSGPERFAAYVDGVGTRPPGGTARGSIDYYAGRPDLIGFFDVYRDAATETVAVGYINVREDFRRRGVARRLVNAMLAAYPRTATLHWGLLAHTAVQRIYLEQYRAKKFAVAGWRSAPGVPFVFRSGERTNRLMPEASSDASGA